jgi:MFS family permease
MVASSERGPQRWPLIAACSSQFMILLDVTIVNVALPSIQRDLDVAPGTLVWTINAYVLPLASSLPAPSPSRTTSSPVCERRCSSPARSRSPRAF